MEHQETNHSRQVPVSQVPGGAGQTARPNPQPRANVTKAQMPQTPVRRVRRPARASSSQKIAIVCLTLGFVFLIGALFGAAVCRFVWEGPPPQQETDLFVPVLTDSPSTQPQPVSPTEPVVTTTAPATVPVTQPAVKATTAPATESVTEPHFVPPQEPQPEPVPEPEPEPEPEPATEPTVEPTEPPATETEFIIPDSNTRYLTAEDYESLSDWDLTIALNELYARHGYEFQTPEIRAHFESCSWYKGTLGVDGFRADMFNDIELANSRLLRAALDAR